MRLRRTEASRYAFALLTLLLIAGLPAAATAQTAQERGEQKSEAAPGKKAPRAAKPPREQGQAPRAPKGEPVPEEAPGQSDDGCPFFERKLELIV